MKLTPFLLDQWLELKHSPDYAIRYDLASSMGPRWTLRELLALGGESPLDALLDEPLVYANALGGRELREAIAARERVPVEQVSVVTGAAEGLLILFALAAESGANVVIPEPGFPAKRAVAEGLGLEVRAYRLRRENGFAVDADEVARLLDRNTRLVVVSTPNNPSGASLDAATMSRLYELAEARGAQFVSDEVYYGSELAAPALSARGLPRATRLGDLSKALCLAGLRIGWFVEPEPERRAAYLNARQYFTISNAVPSERLGRFALEHHEEIAARARRIALERLAQLDVFFDRHAERVRWVRPSGGFTGFPWLADGRDARPFCRRAAGKGVLVAPGDCFGRPEHFRLGYGACGDGFAEALERLGEALEEDAAQAAAVKAAGAGGRSASRGAEGARP